MKLKTLSYSALFTALLVGSFLYNTQLLEKHPSFQKPAAIPQDLDRLIEEQHSLPRYEEAGYSPLGRSPVVDVVLGDPFYLPKYAELVSEIITKESQKNSLLDTATAIFIAGGIPILSEKNNNIFLIQLEKIPDRFSQTFGDNTGKLIYSYWLTFSETYREVESILSVLTPEEKQWIRENYDSFFFGENAESDSDYDFFTTKSAMPLKFYELASRIDLTKLANSARRLSLIVDDLYDHWNDFLSILIKEDFIWEEGELKLIISAKNNVKHSEKADFFIDLGGNNTFYNNAGGTGGHQAAALHIDLFGNNKYFGDNFVQGAGFLGVGVLASFSGNNMYKALAYSQGCGFFGVGLNMNLGSNNHFELDFGGQSFALFGSSLLWNKGGNNQFIAHQGMAQAASSTLGVAFLINNEGNNNFSAGVSGKGGSRYGGIGQGGSTGVRGDPWKSHASFYGGLSFLYSGGGHNKFKTAWIGQGSAYFLSAGILVAEGSNDEYYADYDAQGQALHLAAGLLLQKGGQNHYEGGWGSLGVAGDRSIGMFIGKGSHNFYQGADQSIGTARKPKAIGVFINTQGYNKYIFKKSSIANVQLPETPNEWPTAIFLELGGNNTFSTNVDDMKRGDNLRWGIENHSIGIDLYVKQKNISELLFTKFPSSPRVHYPFDPINGWQSNTAFRPLKKTLHKDDIDDLIDEILTSDYDHRRQLYESIDLIRFTHPNLKIDLSKLLQNPANAPVDQFNYAGAWYIQSRDKLDIKEIMDAVFQNKISSEYARKVAIGLLGNYWTPEVNPILTQVMLTDPSQDNRYTAAFMLAKNYKLLSLPFVKQGLKSDSEGVRYAIAKGLKDNQEPQVLELVKPLFKDPSFYVQRAAALTAVSLHDKSGISVLLNTLDHETLDTTDNYGDNIYNTLSEYACVDFGLDKAAWRNWWSGVKDSYQFPDKPCKKAKSK